MHWAEPKRRARLVLTGLLLMVVLGAVLAITLSESGGPGAGKLILFTGWGLFRLAEAAVLGLLGLVFGTFKAMTAAPSLGTSPPPGNRPGCTASEDQLNTRLATLCPELDQRMTSMVPAEARKTIIAACSMVLAERVFWPAVMTEALSALRHDSQFEAARKDRLRQLYLSAEDRYLEQSEQKLGEEGLQHFEEARLAMALLLALDGGNAAADTVYEALVASRNSQDAAYRLLASLDADDPDTSGGTPA